jgi:hypothetical protein
MKNSGALPVIIQGLFRREVWLMEKEMAPPVFRRRHSSPSDRN